MKPWGDALSGARVLLSQWLPRWLGGGPTCPTMAAMQSHLPYVTDYANAARRFGTVDVMVRIPSSVLRLASRYDLKNYSAYSGVFVSDCFFVRVSLSSQVRPAVANIPILAFGRYAEIVRAGHEAGLRAIRAWKIANPDAAIPLLNDGLWGNGGGARGGGGGGGGNNHVGGGSGLRRAAPSTETLQKTAALFDDDDDDLPGGLGFGDLRRRSLDEEDAIEAAVREELSARRSSHGGGGGGGGGGVFPPEWLDAYRGDVGEEDDGGDGGSSANVAATTSASASASAAATGKRLETRRSHPTRHPMSPDQPALSRRRRRYYRHSQSGLDQHDRGAY